MLLKTANMLVNNQRLIHKLINALLFQIGWFICLLIGDVVAVFFTALVLIVHWRYILQDNNEWWLIAIVTFFGFILDSSLSLLGVFKFDTSSAGYIPIWLLCIWCLFATTLCHSMQWLHRYIKWAPLLGGVAAASSYYGGYRLGSVDFYYPVIWSILYIGLSWSVAFPFMIFYAKKIQKI